MMDGAEEVRLAVRMKREDMDALEWLMDYIQEQVGPGVRINQTDAVRWALHTCRAGLEAESTGRIG